MVIRKEDRVEAVIRRDESLIDVFAAAAPVFERLRLPGLRKVMARLVTVEQAARIAGVDADELVRRLNGDDDPSPSGPGAAKQAPRTNGDGAAAGDRPLPPELAAIPPESIVEIDVRPDLRAGREPFSRIMAALRQVPDGGALAVRAIFEPVPLYDVMRRRGYGHHVVRHADDDWRVWFYRTPAEHGEDGAEPVADATAASADPTAEAAPAAAAATPADQIQAASRSPSDETGLDPAADVSPDDGTTHEDDVTILDVRGLEPPEPMARTLTALEGLRPGGTLVQLNSRVPQFLLPELDRRGFAYHIRQQTPNLVRVLIWRAATPATEGP